MTFHLGRGAPLHPSLPKRPQHTREREPARLPPPRVFSQRLIRRAVQQISTTSDRIHARHVVNGLAVTWFRFSAADIPILERAIELAKTEPRARNAGLVLLAFAPGSCIEVGGGNGVIRMRMILRGSQRDEMRLVSDEISALASAIAHFKTTAAYAAFLKGQLDEESLP